MPALEVRALVEHALSDRPGDWRVSIVGSRENDSSFSRTICIGRRKRPLHRQRQRCALAVGEQLGSLFTMAATGNLDRRKLLEWETPVLVHDRLFGSLPEV